MYGYGILLCVKSFTGQLYVRYTARDELRTAWYQEVDGTRKKALWAVCQGLVRTGRPSVISSEWRFHHIWFWGRFSRSRVSITTPDIFRLDHPVPHCLRVILSQITPKRTQLIIWFRQYILCSTMLYFNRVCTWIISKRNSLARTGTRGNPFSLLSWPREGLSTVCGWWPLG